MVSLKRRMTDSEKCNLIEATLPRFFMGTSGGSKLFEVSRQYTCGINPRECVVIKSTNGIINSYWLREFSNSYICFVQDNQLWLETVRNLYLICSAL